MPLLTYRSFELNVCQLVEEQIEHISAESSSEDAGQPSTFSGALESLLEKAVESETAAEAGTLIMKDAPRPSAEEEEETAKLAKKARAESRIAALQRKLFKNKDHKVPTFEGAEMESKLRKVATRGVVKLFNAIKAHQKSQSGGDDTTRKTTDEVTKKKFMDLLKKQGDVKRQEGEQDGEKAAAQDGEEEKALRSASAVARRAMLPKSSAKKSSSSAPSWEVLRDDYLLGAKMKDWNKDSDEE